ncbi:MAG: hypothetical protein ACI8ZF_000556 [Candidatus Midichloriaceae bacterium]|jgi:hypothetical protein
MNDSLFLVNENIKTNSSSIKTIKKSNISSEYVNHIEDKSTYEIYVKSLNKVIDLINDISSISDDVDDAFQANDSTKYSSLQKISDKANSIELIIQEFIKLFSNTKDKSLVTIYNHIYMKFNAIELQTKLFVLKRDKKYLDNSIKACEHLIKLFVNLIE